MAFHLGKLAFDVTAFQGIKADFRANSAPQLVKHFSN